MEAMPCLLTDQSVLLMKLHNLKEIENHLSTNNCCVAPKNLKDLILDRGTTPLILACQQGEFDSVKYLVETWGVDVRAPAKYYTHPSHRYSNIEIEIATPLFVAASHGHDKIVRYLLEKGADVFVKTCNKNARKNDSIRYDGLSPLYGAVSGIHFDSQRPLLEQQEERSAVVRSLLEFGADPNANSFNPSNGKPMWMERMCGADATTALTNHGLDLNRRNPDDGTTLLHYIAALPLYFTKEDSFTIIKLLVEKGADLLARDERSFTPLLKSADGFHESSPNRAVLDYFLERDEYSLPEKIEAMELAGATILFKAQDIPHFPIAFDYWRRALHLRQMAKEASILEKNLGRKIGRHVEWTTLAELNQLEQNPEDCRVQALLVKLRILSGFDVEIHHDLSSQYIDNLSTKPTSLDIEDKFNQILDLRWGIFDQNIRRLSRHPNPNNGMLDVSRDVQKLVSTLSNLDEDHPTFINFEKIQTSLDLILRVTIPVPITIANEEHMNGVLRLTRTWHASHLFYLLKIMFNHPVKPNKRNMTSLSQTLHRLGPHRLGDLLLRTCYYYVRHSKPYLALVEFGAKLYQVNKAGKTALDIWIELNETEVNWNEETGGWSARPEWCHPIPTLLRLTARVIRTHKIPYADGKTPINLHSLIELR